MKMKQRRLEAWTLRSGSKSRELIIAFDDGTCAKVLDDYEEIDKYTLSEFNDDIDIKNANNIIVEEIYESDISNGYFSIEIFSYKNKDIIGFTNIDESKYIEILAKKEVLKINNHDFYVGYSSQDDYEEAILRAYVRHNDYVILFTMSNSDDPTTKKQYDEFISMINTVKFK